MKIGIILSTNEPELAWNAMRFGLTALKKGHLVKTFLLARGVELEEIGFSTFDIKDQLEEYQKRGGEVLACGTCLKLRNKGGTEACPMSTMNDLLTLVEESDKVLTFG